MKDSCNKDKCARHSAWIEKLNKAHDVYVAKEAYTSYDMYKRIVDMKVPPSPKWSGIQPEAEQWQASLQQEVDD